MTSAIASRLALACCLIALAVAPRVASAATQLFVTIPGVTGDSTAQGFTGSIEALSMSGGVSFATPSAPTGRVAGQGRPSFSDFTFLDVVSSASPVLEQAVPSQRVFPVVVISYVKNGFIFLTYTLSNATLTTYQVSGSNEVPTEAFSFAYTRIQTQFTPQLANGAAGTPVKACWDLAQQASCL